MLLLDAQGRTVGTPKPGRELKAVVLKATAPAQFTLVTARDGGAARTAKIKITLPHGGGSQIIDSHGLTVDAKNLAVTGFSSRGAGG